MHFFSSEMFSYFSRFSSVWKSLFLTSFSRLSRLLPSPSPVHHCHPIPCPLDVMPLNHRPLTAFSSRTRTFRSKLFKKTRYITKESRQHYQFFLTAPFNYMSTVMFSIAVNHIGKMAFLTICVHLQVNLRLVWPPKSRSFTQVHLTTTSVLFS